MGLQHRSLDSAGMGGPVLTSDFHEVVPEHETFVVIAADAPRFYVQDLGEGWECGRPSVEDLVDLLLVLGEVDLRAGVVDEVHHLSHRIGWIEPGCDPADRNGGEVEDDPLGAVFGVDRNDVTFADAECKQTVRCVEGQVPELGPGVFLPNAKVLLSHRDTIWHALRPVAHPARNRWEHGAAR